MSRPGDRKPNTKLRARGVILTCAIAAVTIVGTYYGAGLKTQQQKKEIKKKVTVDHQEDELINALLSRKQALAQAKESWERKAEALRQRVEANSQRTIGGASENSSSSSSSGGGSAPSGK